MDDFKVIRMGRINRKTFRNSRNIYNMSPKRHLNIANDTHVYQDRGKIAAIFTERPAKTDRVLHDKDSLDPAFVWQDVVYAQDNVEIPNFVMEMTPSGMDRWYDTWRYANTLQGQAIERLGTDACRDIWQET